jgi:hypothetical protein
MSLPLDFLLQQNAIQLVNKLDESFGVLLAAGCFRKCFPIVHLDGFHKSPREKAV